MKGAKAFTTFKLLGGRKTRISYATCLCLICRDGRGVKLVGFVAIDEYGNGN